jgi:HSP20 family protein
MSLMASRLGASLTRMGASRQGRALAPAIRAYKADPQQHHNQEVKKSKQQHEGSSALEAKKNAPESQAAAVARSPPSAPPQAGMMMMAPRFGGLEALGFPPSAVAMLRAMDQMMAPFARDPFFSRVFEGAGADDFFSSPSPSLLSPRRAALAQQQQQQQPALLPLDISDSGKAYLVKADLPGVDKSDVAVEVSPDGQFLTISGSRFDETREGGGENEGEGGENEGGEGASAPASASAPRPLRLERRWSSWSRSLALSADVDAENVKASLKDGVLVVELPKRAQEEEVPPAPKRVAVE